MEKLETPDGIFTNNEETGQTAQEVYDEWVANKNNPPIDADSELASEISKATTLGELKDALLGADGIARVKGRQK